MNRKGRRDAAELLVLSLRGPAPSRAVAIFGRRGICSCAQKPCGRYDCRVVSYCVYLLTNFTNTVLYTGVTNDLCRRTWEHREKLVPGFTKRYNVWKLVYFEDTADVQSAIAREKQIKAGPRRRKVELIVRENATWRDLYPELCEGKES